MKKKTFLISVCIFFMLSGVAISTLSMSCTLGWDSPTENTDGSPLTDLTGFMIYYKEHAEENFSTVIDTGSVLEEHTISNLSPYLAYDFVITAYNSIRNESEYSDMLTLGSEYSFSPSAISTNLKAILSVLTNYFLDE